ncbi:hypothetical protein [Leucobacter triazinivorans]|uniref:Phage tail protein n=1 Tax=Leucobacter triazinivorans TaxID=1784719 RepID=A0A4P6KF31_9MICO|nr:hypothetical protein [Leucobacter triazinivorans]QBE48750.1 hypothetical protein EVS81_07825 [Leucobacter triazinivorans]
MAEQPVNARLVKQITLKVGEDSFSKHVNNCRYARTSSMQEWRGGTPDAVFTDETAPTYTFELTGIQDWETATSLCNFLLEHEGETAEVEYKPHHDGEVSFISDIKIVSPEIGGAVGAYNEFTVTMGSTKPTLVRTPAGP